MNCFHPILVANYFDQHNLVTREYATLLIKEITNTPCDVVELDFSGISFISRSFADQFHKEKIELWQSGKKQVHVLNAGYDVCEMLKAVSRTQDTNNRTFEKYPRLHFKSRRFIKEYLF